MNPIEEDRVVSIIPVHFSDTLVPGVHLHQYPLLNRPLHVPPSATASGKRIRARVKPGVRRLEVHIPVDARPEVWNTERSKDLGAARATDDKERNQEPIQKGKQREVEEHRLSEVRLRGEAVPHNGAYVLGVMRDGASLNCVDPAHSLTVYSGVLHLHPISETYQFRPTLTHIDVLNRKNKRSRGGADSDNDSDDGPPPDPDDPTPNSPPKEKKEKKRAGESKEVQVSVRKVTDDKGMSLGGGLTAVRRDMLMAIRAEEDEKWEDYEYHDEEVGATAL